jgi:hypothetical protein
MTCSILITILVLVIKITCAHNGLQTSLRPNQVFRVWVVDLQPIWDEQKLETCFTHRDDIRICALDVQRSWTKNGIESWTAKTEVIGLYSFDLRVIYTEYVLVTFRASYDKILFTSTEYIKLSGNVIFDKWRNSYNNEILAAKLCGIRATNINCTKSKSRSLALDIQPLWQITQLFSSEYGFKRDLSQLGKFVYLRSTYSISVLNLESKLEWQKVMK